MRKGRTRKRVDFILESLLGERNSKNQRRVGPRKHDELRQNSKAGLAAELAAFRQCQRF